MAVINKVQLQNCFESESMCFSLLVVHHFQHLAGWDLSVRRLSTIYIHAKAKSGDKSPKQQEVAENFRDQAYTKYAP